MDRLHISFVMRYIVEYRNFLRISFRHLKSLHHLRHIMKRHLPKSLLLSLQSALTLAAPLAVTLGSTAWAGWAKDGRTGDYLLHYDANTATSKYDEFRLPTADNGVTNIKPGTSEGQGYENIYMCAGSAAICSEN